MDVNSAVNTHSSLAAVGVHGQPNRKVDDPSPLNWTKSRKLRNLCLVSFQAFTSPFASSVIAPGLPAISVKYGITSESVQALVLTIFLLAWAVGPLLFGPISELYGRRLIFNISSVIFTVFSVACIFARSTEELILFRFLAGVGASTPISIAAAVIADMYDLADRGTANAIYGFGLLIGPPIGPLIGGYIIQDVEVKYAFILTASLSGLACILGLLFFDETHHRIIQQQLEKSTWLSLSRWRQSPTLVDASNKHDAAAKYSSDELRWSFRKAFMPLILLYESKICMILSLYGALVYAFLNVFFTTFPVIFSEIYGFGPGATGLTYLGGGLGEIFATVFSGWFGNAVYLRLIKRNNGRHEPEFRIPGMLIGSVLVPIGLLWFGWSAHAHVHWMMPIIGAAIFGFGMISILLPLQLYVIDAFRDPTLALASVAVARSLLAFSIPLFTPQMIQAMGLGGTFSFLAGLSIVIGIPLPIWIFYKGGDLRLRSPFGTGDESI